MLFAIGAGPQVVAVSSYDEDPPQVKSLPQVGALLDPDMERILSLKPDLVITYGSRPICRRSSPAPSIPIFDYRHGGLTAITRDDAGAGRADRPSARGRRRRPRDRGAIGGGPSAHIQLAETPDAARVRPRARARCGTSTPAAAAASCTTCSRPRAATNVFADIDRESVQATTELILTRAPEVILEVRSADIDTEAEAAKETASWSPLASVPAVRQKRVIVLDRQGADGTRAARGRGRRADGPGPAPVRLKMNAFCVSWSSGKDSAWMLHVLKQQHPGAVRGCSPRTNEAFDRVAMHAVRRSLVEAQAQAAGLPLHVVPLPWPCSNEEYERRMGAAVRSLVAEGFTHVAFGDLFLEDVRRYREDRLADTGLTPLFPLWKTKSTAELAREMIDGGLRSSPDVRGSAGSRSRIRRPPLRRRAAARSASGGRPVRRARRVPLVCVCRPDVLRTHCGDHAGEIVDRDGFVFCDLEAARSSDDRAP